MFKSVVKSTTVLAAAALFASAAHAAPTVYFGENQSPGATTTGAPVTARNAFLGQLSGVDSQGFESFTVGSTAPLVLSFTGSGTPLVATLTGDGLIANASTAGRFNTTPGGSNWWDVSGTFDITFATAISAFGFYGTDVGDFDGQITLALTDINDVVSNLTVGNTQNGLDGSLLFYGFIDSGTSYKSIRFGNTNARTDFFGFDDMVIGDLRQITPRPTPEPGSLALVAAALLGLGLARRRA